MAHFAQIDENNVVTLVLVTNNDDPNGDEGYQWLIENIGGRWVKTSYNTFGGQHLTGGIPFRKNFAGIGHIYDETRDAFIPPQPFPSWILDEETCWWEPPTPMPTDGIYEWNEETTSWVSIG